MANSALTSAFFDGRANAHGPNAHGHRAIAHAALLGAASLATAGGLLWFASDMAARNHREAGRILVDAQKGVGYPTVVVSGLVTRHARPR